MSTLAKALLAQHPHWSALPAELSEAFAWMEQQPGHASEPGAGPFLTPYPGTRQMGVVFTSGLTLEGWVEEDSDAAAQLLPIAESDGAGGMLALWRREGVAADAVVLINDMEQVIVAENALELLRLIAIGHDELRGFSLADEPPEENAAAHAAFRAWVQERFEVEIPEAWDDVERADEFTQWLEDATGGAEDADDAPSGTIEAAGSEVGRVSMTGPITTLLDLLGQADGPEPAAVLGEFVGGDLGGSLKSGARKAKKRGIEVSVEKGTIATFWVHIDFAAEGLFGSPPIEYPWWQGPDLIDGLTATSTKEDVVALFGEPERTGTHHNRYRVGDAFVNISHGTDGLSQITLMSEAP